MAANESKIIILMEWSMIQWTVEDVISVIERRTIVRENSTESEERIKERFDENGCN